MDRLEVLERALRSAEEVLAFLEVQSAGYTELTIPAHLKIDLEKKREEVSKYKEQLDSLRKSSRKLKVDDSGYAGKIILSQDDVNLLIGLIYASRCAETPQSRRELLITIGDSPDEYQLSGIDTLDFAKTLVYHLNQNGDYYILERILDEIAKFLPPSYMERIHQARRILESAPENLEIDDLRQPAIPSLEEVLAYTQTLSNNIMKTHIQFLDGIGYYFLQTEPIALDDDYIKAVEKLLNDLEFRGFQSKWPIEFQNIVLDALCLAADLASVVKKYPNEARRQDFTRNARQLGRILNLLHWRNRA